MPYPGLFNSTYQPSPFELLFIATPVDQLGPPLLGQMFMTLLEGVIIVQYYDYLLNFWGEKRWTKWLVHGGAWLCTLKFAYIWWFIWNRFVVHYGDWDQLAVISPLTVPLAISGIIPNAVCQAFYITRCWALSHNLYFLVPAVTSLVVTVGSGIAQTWGAALLSHNDPKGFTIIVDASNVSLSCGLACDVFITTFTCYYLVRRKTGFSQTDGLVQRLRKISIESAAGPTIVALINLILNNRLSLTTQWFLFPNIVLTQVYGVSLMYTVNARKNVGEKTLTAMVTGSLVSAAKMGSKSRSGTGTDNSRQPSFWNPRSWRRNKDEYEMQGRAATSTGGVLVEVQTIRHEDDIINAQAALKQEKQGSGSFTNESGKGGYFSAV